MTLLNTNNRDVIVSTGATSFAYTSQIFAEDELKVIVTDSDGQNPLTKTLGVDYTISGVGSSSGGNVVFTSSVAAGKRVILALNTPFTQTTDFTVADGFPAETFEEALDRLSSEILVLKAQVNRCLQLPENTPTMSSGVAVPDHNIVANQGKLLRLTADGVDAVTVTPGAYAIIDPLVATGSTASRAIADRFGEWKNVKDFGAVGDNVNNDGPAILAALAAGKNVWFPPGTYKITDSSLVGLTKASHDGRVLMGSGVNATTLNFANGSADCIKIDGTDAGANQLSGFKISDMSLKTTSKTGGRILAISFAYKTQLQNLYIEAWNGIEAYVTNNFDIENVNIQGVTGGSNAPASYYGPAGQAPARCFGLYWHAPSDGTYRSDALRAINFTIQASYSGADGILWDGEASTLDAFQCTTLSVNYGLRIRNSGASGSRYPQFGEFHNFNVDGAMTQGVRIEGGAGMRFVGCNISNTSGAGGQGNADTNALYIAHDEPNSYTRNLQFVGSTISNCRQDTALVAARNVKFVGCAFYDGGKAAANTYNGLTIETESEDVVVVGNGVGMYGANNNYKYAVQVKDTTVRVNVSANQLFGYTTKAILWGNNDSSSICQMNTVDGSPPSMDVLPIIIPQAQTVTGNFTATAAQICNGNLVLSGTPGAHNMTTPTAAQIVAQISSPSPGKGLFLQLVNATNGTTTWVAGTGVSLTGTAFTLALGTSKIYIIRINDIRAGSESVTIYG